MNLKIRKAQHQDAAKIIAAHRRSIREVCSRDYTPEQISAWSGRDFQEQRWCDTIDRGHVWVVADDRDNIYGFGRLKITTKIEAEIAGLYFVPEVVGKGLGKALVNLILHECKRRGFDQVTLYATKTAKAFYQSRGFQQSGDVLYITMGGVKVECFKMDRSIANVPKYRRGVAIIILSKDRQQILLGERAKQSGQWQIPQGGAENDETIIETLERELYEEIGISLPPILNRTKEYIPYDWPSGLFKDTKFLGQEHIYFALDGSDLDISTLTPTEEFANFKWVPCDEVVSHTVEWKKEALVVALKELGLN